VFRPVRMKRLNLLVLERDVQAVTEGLAELGAMHVTQARQPGTETLLDVPDVGPRLERCRRVLRLLEELAEHLGLPLDPEAKVDFHAPFALEEISKELDTLRRRLRRVEQSTAEAQQRIPELQAMLLELEPFRSIALPLEELENFNFLHFATGSLPSEEALAVAEEVGDRSIILPLREEGGRTKVLTAAGKRSGWALETALKNHGFHPEPLAEGREGLAVDITEQLEKQLEETHAATGEAEEARRALGRELGGNINQLWRRAVVEQRILEAQQRFGKTTSTYAISGWVPGPDVETVSQRVRAVTRGRVIIEEQDAQELLAQGEKVPTLMRHGWLLRPFQVLVSGYGAPCYNEVEPTAFVAFSFVLMFGMMFGDVGHGALLAVTALVVRQRVRSRGLRDFAFVLTACGLSSVLFGFLYGSVFGYEDIIPALWLHPMKDINTLLKVVLGFGISMISLGLVLNIVNRVSEKRYFEGLMSHYGLMGFILYWGTIGLALRYFTQGAGSVTGTQILLFVVVPLVLLILAEPLRLLLSRRPAAAAGIARAVVEGAMDMYETMMSFLANTVSFIRVGAFALSHAGLCYATFQVADMVRGTVGGSVGAWAVIVLGNLFVVGLEGLVVTIQAVRLEYYEFFSKFFSGEGWTFRPLNVGSQE